MLYYDILIVGAGPAGSSAASAAAKEGAKVLLVDRKRVIGQPAQCAEYIPKPLLMELDRPISSIVQQVKGIRTYLPNGEHFYSDAPGCILNRALFDKELALNAVNNGADLFINTICAEKKDEKVVIKKNEEVIEVIANVIIGADGPHSTVGEWIDCINKDFAIGFQNEVPLTTPLDYTEVYFNKKFHAGYGWLFPKGETANVGIGLKFKPKADNNKLPSLLQELIDRLEKEGKVKNSPLAITAGLIPVGGPLQTVKDNILLVGDAAGHTHPISGGGIPQAVICGKIAGKIAAKAVKKRELGLLALYEKEWKKIFQNELERGKQKRKLLESQWDELDNIIKRCWITFREYYHE